MLASERYDVLIDWSI